MAPVPDEAVAATRDPEVRGCGVGGAAPPAGGGSPTQLGIQVYRPAVSKLL